ncbi:MAG: phosphoglucosamine mutase [Ignavibacteria bacterium]|nr:phosphoglucosamine mutase [Ignavibacteria bacterium]
MAIVRSISGIRGTIGEGFSPNVIANYVSAFSELLPQGPVVIGRDGRPSGIWVEQICIGTLLAMNRKVLNAGIVPTPTVQILVEEFNTSGGISITASHNTAEWNGLKFIKSDGTFFSRYENQKIFEIVDLLAFKFPANFTTQIDNIQNPYEYHLKRIFNLPLFKETNFLDRIRGKKFKVVFDANNSSGSKIIPELLENLGCDVIKINCELNGIFAHPPEPNPENIVNISKIVSTKNADIGFVVDPDADRLVIIDEKGNPIWEELTIALAINSIGEFLEYFYPKSNKVVVNYSTTQVAEIVAKKYGLDVLRSPVGEINVVERMKEHDAILGGEGSGGVILPHCHYGRDSLVGIVLVLSLLAKYNKPISEIINEYPKVFMKKNKYSINSDFENKIEELVNSLGISLLDVNTEDGYRMDGDFGWIHIRKSNTEPIARVIFETKTQEDFIKVNRMINALFVE